LGETDPNPAIVHVPRSFSGVISGGEPCAARNATLPGGGLSPAGSDDFVVSSSSSATSPKNES